MSCNHSFWTHDGLCYFCRKETKWKDITLADGCAVPACGICYAMMVKGRKLAQERGYYDPKRMGGDRMVKAEIIEDEYFNGEYASTNDIRSVKFVSEPDYVTGNYGTKLEGNIKCPVEGKKNPHIWTLNKTNNNILGKVLGLDTSKWMNIDIPIDATMGSNQKYQVIINEARLRKVISEE